MRAAIPALALALCACGREASFDERYSGSENQIEQRAHELDAQLNGSNANGRANGGSDVQPS